MITDQTLELLLEKYFKEHLQFTDYSQASLLSGKAFFIRCIAFCQTLNVRFPNFELITSSYPDRIYDENFFFGLCDHALGLATLGTYISIVYFDEIMAKSFYINNINRYLPGTVLEEGPHHQAPAKSKHHHSFWHHHRKKNIKKRSLIQEYSILLEDSSAVFSF